MNINKNLSEIEVSIIRRIVSDLKNYDDVINLTIGEPDLEVPKEIKEEVADKVLNTNFGYSELSGMKELREEISNLYNTNHGSNYDADNVVITVGSTEAISSTIKALTNKGDEVLIPTPAYVGYEPLNVLSELKSVFIDTKEDDFILTKENLEKHITDKTKLLILTYPNNPSGRILPFEEMKKIAEFLRDKNIYIIGDEIYSSIVFQKFHSFAEFDFLKEKLIIINGFSKAYSMTGYRVGYLIADHKLRNEILKVNQYTVTSAASLSQYAAITALQKFSDRSDIANIYKERVEYLSEELSRLGFDVNTPEGAFYVFAGYENISDMSSYDFIMDMIKTVGVACIPGDTFKVEGFIRLSAVHDIEVLKEAINRIEKYIDDRR